jgi:hypothetical protein
VTRLPVSRTRRCLHFALNASVWTSLWLRPVLHVIGRSEITGIGLLKIARQLGIYGMKPIDCLVYKIHTRQSIYK